MTCNPRSTSIARVSAISLSDVGDKHGAAQKFHFRKAVLAAQMVRKNAKTHWSGEPDRCALGEVSFYFLLLMAAGLF
jgi:hypothetical protein